MTYYGPCYWCGRERRLIRLPHTPNPGEGPDDLAGWAADAIGFDPVMRDAWYVCIACYGRAVTVACHDCGRRVYWERAVSAEVERYWWGEVEYVPVCPRCAAKRGKAVSA